MATGACAGRGLPFGCLLWCEIFVIFDEVTERRILFTSNRGIEREDILRNSHDLTDLTNIHLELQGKFFHEGFSSEFLGEATIGVIELIDRLDHMYRYSDRPSLISNSTSNSLANPPCRIRRELESSIRIELIDRTKKSNIPFLHEIEESESTTHIFLCDRDHQSEIRFGKAFTCFLISLLDEATETNFLFSIDERESSNLIEIHADRVVRNL